MRSDGVSGFPDPGASGGIHVSASAGFNPQSPAFQSAMQKVEGSSPFSRFDKAPVIRGFLLGRRAHGLPRIGDI